MTDPQVLTALITGIVSVVVAVVGLVPTILSANAPTATPTFTHTFTPTFTQMVTASPTDTMTFTVAPPTSTSEPASPTTLPPTATTEIVVAQGATSTPRPLEPLATDVPPTLEPTIEPTLEPTVEQVIVEENQPEPNVLLIFDDVAFTVVNVSGNTISLDGVRFRSDSGKWDVKRWGGKSVYGALPDDKCLRLRDSAAGNRNPPGECRDLHALHITGGDALFWLNVSEFEIRKNKDTIATCKTDTDRCAIYVPQD